MPSEPNYTIVGINYWPEPTGNAPYNSDLAEALAEVGKVTVITGIPHYPWWKKQKHHSDDEYINRHPHVSLFRKNHFVPSSHSNATRAIMEFSFGFSAIFSGKLKGPKVVLISPAMLSSAISIAWLRLFHPNTKTLVWVQDLYEQGLNETNQGSQRLNRIIASVENWMLTKADRVVMAHPVFLQAKSDLVNGSSKFSSIPNWSQFEFKPNESVSETKSKFGLADTNIVLHIGNMGVKQGLENVIEAAKLAKKNNSKFTFVFVGGGNQLENLKELGKNISNVRFIPPVSEADLANLMQAADLLLVHEKPGVKHMSIPSKLTTYYLSGRPVVVCSEPDSLAGKAVIENKTGIWVQSGNPKELLNSLETLNLEKSEKVAKQAKRFAEENLGKNSALNQFVNILSNL